MIASLKGILKTKATDSIIVDCQGVGYQVFVSLNTFYELPLENHTIDLHIHTHITQDHWSLYGFLNPEEKIIFQQLIKVSGIGPKMALNLLSGLNPYEVAQAISKGDAAALTKIPGIGQKTAERIIVDLKGKILASAKALSKPQASQTYDEALSALIHLGYTRGQAEGSLSKLNWEKGFSLEEAIRQSLKNLGRGV